MENNNNDIKALNENNDQAMPVVYTPLTPVRAKDVDIEDVEAEECEIIPLPRPNNGNRPQIPPIPLEEKGKAATIDFATGVAGLAVLGALSAAGYMYASSPSDESPSTISPSAPSSSMSDEEIIERIVDIDSHGTPIYAPAGQTQGSDDSQGEPLAVNDGEAPLPDALPDDTLLAQYAVYTDGQGNVMEVAYVVDSATGTAYAVCDTDGDGVADILLRDETGMGTFDEVSLQEIGDLNFDMAPLHDEYVAEVGLDPRDVPYNPYDAVEVDPGYDTSDMAFDTYDGLGAAADDQIILTDDTEQSDIFSPWDDDNISTDDAFLADDSASIDDMTPEI